MFLRKRLFLYGLHGAISQKVATFIITVERPSNPTAPPIIKNTHAKDLFHISNTVLQFIFY
jgi:hypothetical protein